MIIKKKYLLVLIFFYTSGLFGAEENFDSNNPLESQEKPKSVDILFEKKIKFLTFMKEYPLTFSSLSLGIIGGGILIQQGFCEKKYSKLSLSGGVLSSLIFSLILINKYEKFDFYFYFIKKREDFNKIYLTKEFGINHCSAIESELSNIFNKEAIDHINRLYPLLPIKDKYYEKNSAKRVFYI